MRWVRWTQQAGPHTRTNTRGLCRVTYHIGEVVDNDPVGVAVAVSELVARVTGPAGTRAVISGQHGGVASHSIRVVLEDVGQAVTAATLLLVCGGKEEGTQKRERAEATHNTITCTTAVTWRDAHVNLRGLSPSSVMSVMAAAASSRKSCFIISSPTAILRSLLSPAKVTAIFTNALLPPSMSVSHVLSMWSM